MCACHVPKLTPSDFNSKEEAVEWVEAKTASGPDPDKMPKIDAVNWKLSEY